MGLRILSMRNACRWPEDKASQTGYFFVANPRVNTSLRRSGKAAWK